MVAIRLRDVGHVGSTAIMVWFLEIIIAIQVHVAMMILGKPIVTKEKL